MSYGLQHATVRFGDVVAIDSVSLRVDPGRVVAVVGGDGAGKTTLLRALVGLVGLDAGSVHAPAADGIGYLPATAGSWLELSVAENLQFAGSVFGLRGRALRERAAMLIENAGLGAARDRLSGQLSGGMRRKLGYSMAIVHNPPLLVLDEPSTGVDPVSRIDLWRLISHAAASGAAVVMSTTYLDEAERAAAIVLLDGGRALLQGPPDELLAGFTGVVTAGTEPARPQWAWRRGRVFHEWWPDDPSAGTPVAPDLEDVVVTASLRARQSA